MTLESTIKDYFRAIHGGGWEDFIADDVTFIRNNLDNKVTGKAAYLQGAGTFFKNTTDIVIEELIISGDTAAVLARYTIVSPTGKKGSCDVAEFLTFASDKLTSSAVFFDRKLFGEFMVSN